MSNHAASSNLNYLIDPTFYYLKMKISTYYVPKVEVKDFNVLIDAKPFFEILVKVKEEAYEQIIAIDLCKQIELENPDLKQQINFIGRLEEDATMFFITEKKEETTFDFSQNSVTVV